MIFCVFIVFIEIALFGNRNFFYLASIRSDEASICNKAMIKQDVESKNLQIGLLER